MHLKHFVCYIDAVARPAFHAAKPILIDILIRCVCICLWNYVSVCMNVWLCYNTWPTFICFLELWESFELKIYAYNCLCASSIWNETFNAQLYTKESKSESIEQKPQKQHYIQHIQFNVNERWLFKPLQLDRMMNFKLLNRINCTVNICWNEIENRATQPNIYLLNKKIKRKLLNAETLHLPCQCLSYSRFNSNFKWSLHRFWYNIFNVFQQFHPFNSFHISRFWYNPC